MMTQPLKVAFTLTVLCSILGTSSLSFARCKIRPDQIESVAASLGYRNDDGGEENTAIIANTFEPTVSKKKNSYIADYEAFIRPDGNAMFQPLPIPLFIVQMEKQRDSVYICAHYDSANPEKSVALVYFLSYNRIHAITPVPIALSEVFRVLGGRNVENSPLMLAIVPLRFAEKIQALFVHAFGTVTKVGIDRLRITSTKIELLSGGNPAQFDHFLVGVIDFNGKPLPK